MNHLGELDQKICQDAAVTEQCLGARRGSVERGGQEGGGKGPFQTRAPKAQGMPRGELSRELCLIGGKGVSGGAEGCRACKGLCRSVHSHA